ncbi:MAG: hypothetical protein KKD38_06635, partial [Candidatus Delongbacteria bacterium]|nr:hypothetical protein [Candidatus Delongbacteria bacterium]MCG2760493.1 hypothetical protein [Candidatus Delongbacteria bacterium]
MIKCFLFLLLFITVSAYSRTSKIVHDQSGVAIIENIQNDFRFQSENINGSILKKIILPEDYLLASRYPETEFYEKIFYFAVPDGSKAKLNYNVLNSVSLVTSELVPAQKFIKGGVGILSAVYEIPEKRLERNLPHAEISYAGYINRMNVYKLIFRPLTIDGGKAYLATNISIKIKFDIEFDNDKAENIKPADLFEENIINLDYAKNNPVNKQKEIVQTFLDRQTEWVKIKIKDEGIYKISGASLKNLGLDISSAITERVKVYSSAGKDINNNPVDSLFPVYHGAQEISRRIVDGNGDGFFNDNDYIIFYAVQTTSRDSGKAVYYFDKYSENTFYWIDLGIGTLTAGKDIPQLASPLPGYVGEFAVFQRYEFSESRNSLYYDDFFWWYNKIINPLQTLDISFNMKDIDNSFPVQIKVYHSIDIPVSLSKIKYSVNNFSASEAESYSANFEKEYSAEYFIENSKNILSMTNIVSGKYKYYNGF